MRKIKNKQTKLIYGYEFKKCPICKAKTFDYVSYSEGYWGIVERHGFCVRCGYIIEQAYSPSIDGFIDTKKGYKKRTGEYVPKNIKKHKRIRRKLKIKNYDYEINPEWTRYI